MKPTKKGWDEKFTYLTDDLGLETEELHAKDLFKNRKAWRITRLIHQQRQIPNRGQTRPENLLFIK